ncbi:sodium:neurotransmitter symporter [Nitratireductor aquibiodomus RA22]|uniref:Transporter n=2 Tax=Nitratireductor aquibiodomus TaxID=204799 RepID=I5BRV5_9HYPH|nr:sodium:neurotransmitter symporter [Nitratireductor aquibiodomus RA22]
MGFILAAAGSAVGLGNVWRFPYVTGENGGGAFLLIYLGIVFSIGVSVLVAELIIGRSTQLDPAGAFRKLAGGAWPIVGYMSILTAFVILSFYCVIAGWTVAYMIKSITGSVLTANPEEIGGVFDAFITDPLEPVLYTALFIGLTVFVALGGVASGIERAARILMPALFVILLVLVARSVTLDGAVEGIAFFLEPDFSKVTWETLLAALGQAFFSLSLGMGAMITYGSYMQRHDDIAGSALAVTVLDALVAVLSGLVILPAVFAFGAAPTAGPGLTFITLPSIFAQMPFGFLFAALFFFLLAIAALTSAVAFWRWSSPISWTRQREPEESGRNSRHCHLCPCRARVSQPRRNVRLHHRWKSALRCAGLSHQQHHATARRATGRPVPGVGSEAQGRRRICRRLHSGSGSGRSMAVHYPLCRARGDPADPHQRPRLHLKPGEEGLRHSARRHFPGAH